MYQNIFPTFGSPFASQQQTASLGFVQKSDISYDTSSREPNAMRARVFVGNLNTGRVSRDDVIQLFKAYGTLAGVTLFKGYAFVQYSNSAEADLSVSALNGYNWNGNVLDVKLAVPGVKPSNAFGSKRGPDVFFGVKRQRLDQVNALNKTYAEKLEEMPEFVSHDETPDTLVCGSCRFVCSRLSDFIEHRKGECTFFKGEGEPTKLQCFTCTDDFSDSWSLVLHLTSVHKLALYKEPNGTNSTQNNNKEGEEEEEEVEDEACDQTEHPGNNNNGAAGGGSEVVVVPDDEDGDEANNENGADLNNVEIKSEHDEN